MDDSDQRISPAATRNVEPIGNVLARLVKKGDKIFEFASGTGQHLAAFALRFPECHWYPSELTSDKFRSIQAYRRKCNTGNFEMPRLFDVAESHSQSERFDLILAINLLHITSTLGVVGTFLNAGQMLRDGGCLVTYGPYRFFGRFVQQSNHLFDQRLRQENDSWGIRDLSQLGLLAAFHQLTLTEIIACPANNHVIIFRKAGVSV